MCTYGNNCLLLKVGMHVQVAWLDLQFIACLIVSGLDLKRDSVAYPRRGGCTTYHLLIHASEWQMPCGLQATFVRKNPRKVATPQFFLVTLALWLCFIFVILFYLWVHNTLTIGNMCKTCTYMDYTRSRWYLASLFPFSLSCYLKWFQFFSQWCLIITARRRDRIWMNL